MGKLEGKAAIVTGAARGIGLATAKLFVEEGAKVLIVDVLEEELAEAADSVEGMEYQVADTSDEGQTRDYVSAAVEKLGGVDVFVANAGILGPILPITEYPTEAFDRLVGINIRGTWLGIKYTVPELKQRGGGSIVLISSIAGVKGFPGVSAYSASKHAITGIMRCAANECAPFNIRVNTLHPGSIQTKMIEELEEGFAPGEPDKGRQALVDAALLKRYGTVEEMAKVMLFLASEDSSYCTGGVFMADGGLRES